MSPLLGVKRTLLEELRGMKDGRAEPYSSSDDFGGTEWAKTGLLQAGVYAEACDINVKGASGRRTIAIAKIAEDALAASMSLFGLMLTASKSLLEVQEGLRSKPIAAIP